MHCVKTAFLFVALNLVPTSAQAVDGVSGSGPFTATFTAKAPMLTVKGVGKDACVPAPQGAIKCDLHAFKTGIGLRDRHMREQLFQRRYATLHHDRLTLNGVTHPVVVTRDGDKLVFRVSLKRFGLTAPCFLKVCVKDSVEVTGYLK